MSQFPDPKHVKMAFLPFKPKVTRMTFYGSGGQQSPTIINILFTKGGICQIPPSINGI